MAQAGRRVLLSTQPHSIEPMNTCISTCKFTYAQRYIGAHMQTRGERTLPRILRANFGSTSHASINQNAYIQTYTSVYIQGESVLPRIWCALVVRVMQARNYDFGAASDFYDKEMQVVYNVHVCIFEHIWSVYVCMMMHALCSCMHACRWRCVSCKNQNMSRVHLVQTKAKSQVFPLMRILLHMHTYECT